MFLSQTDPLYLFDIWFDDAAKSEINDPEAAVLATSDSHNLPNVRAILLKGHDKNGFKFYTNSRSAKGQELVANPQAAMLFHWKSLRRQVRIRGKVEILPSEVSDTYFATRPRGSKIGAWASLQSQPLALRTELEDRVSHFSQQYGEIIPRPDYWNGYLLRPLRIEFWQDGPQRLHDRLVFQRQDSEAAWQKQMLYP